MATSHWWKHPTIFAAVIGAIGMMIVAIIQLTPLLFSSPKPGRFSYSVRVEMKDGRQIINNAKVSIIVGGKTPLIEFTDVNGFSLFSIETDYAGSHGILIVEASGFSVYTQNINIFPDKLPAVVQLETQKQPSPTIEVSSNGTAVAAISTEAQAPLLPMPHNESLTTSPVPPTLLPPTLVPPTLVQVRGKYPCPLTIQASEVEIWKLGQADVPSVREAVAQFDKRRPYNEGAFLTGTQMPSGVLVATNFNENDANAWTLYHVIPVIHSGSYGLFQTTEEYTAPNAGACITIIQ